MKLMRFRIPTGWRVIKNTFFDVEPNKGDGYMSSSVAFVQDILSLEYRADWYGMTCNDSFTIDLGWYPDQDPNGQYRLVLLQKDWEDILCVYENRDRMKVRGTLENWLECVVYAADRGELEQLVRRAI